MSLSEKIYSTVKTYNGSITNTKAQVTTNPNVNIHSINIYNGSGAAAYLQVFDLASANVTVGTTTPTFVIGMPDGAAQSFVFERPIGFSTGLVIASTTTRAGSTSATQEVTITYMDRA